MNRSASPIAGIALAVTLAAHDAPHAGHHTVKQQWLAWWRTFPGK